MLGVTTAASGSMYLYSAAMASLCRSLAPPLATITGSTTRFRIPWSLIAAATASMISALEYEEAEEDDRRPRRRPQVGEDQEVFVRDVEVAHQHRVRSQRRAEDSATQRGLPALQADADGERGEAGRGDGEGIGTDIEYQYEEEERG